MKDRLKLFLLLGLVALALAIAFVPDEAMARAGGGNPKKITFIDYLLFPLLLPFLLIGWVLRSFVIGWKNKRAIKILRRISKKDPMWETNHIKTRIEEAYCKIQAAWRDRNQDIAREYMSQRIYDKHKLKTDDMLRKGIRNVMEDISLKDIKIVEVCDHQDNSKDAFRAVITGAMIDYTIVEETGEIIEGVNEKRSFKELWQFKREDCGWVLDQIDNDFSIFNLIGFKAFSEEVG